jgi:UDP-N-acetyl-D-galactosamine dehydrogenase
VGIRTADVLEAASTKWNFHKYSPGLVGGHCIGVDPYYLTYKAKELGYDARVILAGRAINDTMGQYIASQTVKKMAAAGKDIKETRVLVMGATFKEDVADIRNSKVADVVTELRSFSVNVDWIDPHADAEEVAHEYNHPLSAGPTGKYDAFIVAVSHKEYIALDETWFAQHAAPKAVFVDVKSIFAGKIANMQYWSL